MNARPNRDSGFNRVDAFIIDAVRTPWAAIAGRWPGCGPTTSPHMRSRRPLSEPGSTRRRLRRLPGRRQPGGRGQPRRRSDGGASSGAARRRPGSHRQPALRLGPGGGQPGLAGAAPRRGRPLPGGGRRVDEPGALGRPEAGCAGCRAGPQTMHDTSLGWRLINPRMAERYSTESMGETGENVAERYGIAREEQDRFALRSHTRAVAATREGRFADELVPVEVAITQRSEWPGGRSTSTKDPAPTPRSRSSPACGPRFARAARSPPATPRRSTTAPPASFSPQPERAEALGARPAGAHRLDRRRRRRSRLHGHRPGARRSGGRSTLAGCRSTTST